MATVAHDLSGSNVRRAYSRWAAVYDVLCARLFRPAHRAAAAAANRAGPDILEIGVGTGLLLPLYDRRSRVTGVDLSHEMLSRAARRVEQLGLSHVRRLEQGDVHVLSHPAGSYDAVVLPFVLTLVEDPEAALDNCLRLLKPSGEIVVVSHFQSRTPWLARAERRLAPLVARIGLRPDFPVSRIETWCAGAGAAMLADEPVGPGGVYRLIRIGRLPQTG